MFNMIAWISLAVAFICAIVIAVDEFRHPPKDVDHECRLAHHRPLLQCGWAMGLPSGRPQNDQFCHGDDGPG